MKNEESSKCLEASTNIPLGFRIDEVFALYLGGDLEDLMALYMNLSNVDGEHRSVAFVISDDGETISFSVSNGAETKSSLETAFPDVTSTPVTSNNDLYRLIGQQVQEGTFGVGKLLQSTRNALYYVLLKTTDDELLFFNNGDLAAFSFDKIIDILEHDIYNVKWLEDLTGVCQERAAILSVDV